MDKKAYITPAMEVMNVEMESLMTATSLMMYGEDVDTSQDGVQLGGGRRGTWGNLWRE